MLTISNKQSHLSYDRNKTQRCWYSACKESFRISNAKNRNKSQTIIRVHRGNRSSLAILNVPGTIQDRHKTDGSREVPVFQ